MDLIQVIGTPQSGNSGSAASANASIASGSAGQVVTVDGSGNLQTGVSPVFPVPAVSIFPVSNNLSPYEYYSGSLAGWIEEFQSVGSLTVSAAQGFSCDLGWSSAPVAGTTGTINAYGSSTFTNTGIMLLTTPATSGQGVSVYRGGGVNAAAPLGILGANAGWQLDFWFLLPATITNYAFRIGYCVSGQQVADPPTGGSFFEFDTANTGHDTSHIMFRTVNASTSNYDDTNALAATASTWYHGRIYSKTAGTISYQIGSANGALSSPVSITTDVDTTHACMPLIQVLPRTSSAVTLMIDRISYVALTGRV